MKMKNLLLVCCLGLAATAARGDGKTAQPSVNQADTISGKVVEATNASTYTYILLDTGKAKLWAAAPQFKVKPGDAVTIFGALQMAGYHSPTLNRDFDSVYFTGKVLVNGAKPEEPGDHLPPGHPKLTKEHAKTPKVDLTGIKKAEGGKTVEEIFAGKSKLKGQSVKVRGKVVKYNEKILGQNWIHLKDGTGHVGEDDLMITSETKVKVGDTVLVTGKVSTDRDFGAGYKYSVIIEQAKVAVE